MDKISISRFVEEITKRTGDKADAVMLIAVDGRNVNTSIIGVDDSFVDNNSIALVSAMRAVMEDRLKPATIAYESLMKGGKIKSSFRSIVIRDDEQPEDDADVPSEQNTPEMDFAKALADALNNLIEQKLGGDSDAHDA